jgi:outer membrane protein OmpA-like peptidoglycan-associated protein
MIGAMALGLNRARIAWAAWQGTQLRQSLAWAPGHGLPPASFRQPLVLVCGDGLEALFGAAPDERWLSRTCEEGCYLRVPSPTQLPGLVAHLLALRPQWAPRLAVMLAINPAEHGDSAAFAGQLRLFRHQVAMARRRGAALPVLLTAYLPAERGHGPWFSWEPGRLQPSVYADGQRQALGNWQRQPELWAQRGARWQTAVQLATAADWWAHAVQRPLLEPDPHCPGCPPLACALTLVPWVPNAVSGNLWHSWLAQHSGLQPGAVVAGEPSPLPFADALLSLLPRPADGLWLGRGGRRSLWLGVLMLSLALGHSAWNNGRLARQVGDDLRRYEGLPPAASPAARQAGLVVLQADAERLERYHREGPPWSLGLGFYPGERLRLPVLAALARQAPSSAWRPQTVVRLDSLSLFDSGSAQLKPGSAKGLIQALVGIKAQPGWLIVIAGHTDASGDAKRNLWLSRQRAAAVRDWMQRMGDIPASCFAVQGHGARQPIASNDTAIGRGINRRVDIRLVPEEGACEPPLRASAVHRKAPDAQAFSTHH